jgi:TRAP-type mannitol/chloroaromatic compound transport system permease small subunit
MLRRFDALLDLMNAMGTALIVLMMVFVNADVIFRSAFNAPIAMVPEFAALSIVGIVFLQAGFCLRENHLTRSEALLLALQKRWPRLAVALDGLFHVVGGVLFAIIAWAGWPLLTKAWLNDEYVGSPGSFMLPVWPVKLLVVVGCVCIAIQFLRMALYRLRAATDPAAAARVSMYGGAEL